MARLKRSSNVLETARLRLSGLKSITPKPNFGPALDIDDYEQDINNLAGSRRALCQGNCAPNHYWDRKTNKPDLTALYATLTRP